MGKIFVFLSGFVLFQYITLCAQTSSKEIDLLMEKGRKFSLEYKSDQALKVGEDVLKKSTEINYSKGIIRGNTMLAYEFRNVYDYGKSLTHVYAILSQFKDSVNNDPKLNATLLFLIGDNYLEMGLKKEAIQIGRKLISIADRFKNKDEAYSYSRLGYGMIYSCYKNENRDSAYYYLMQAKYWDDEMEKLANPSSKLLGRSTLLFSIANYYIDYTNHYDSAYYYIEKGIKRRGNANLMSYKTNQLIGKILFKQGKYVKALPYVTSALKDAEEKKKTDEITSIYKLTAQIYGGMRDTTMEKEFQNRAFSHSDSVQQARKKTIQAAVELVKHEVENDILAKQKKVYLYLTVVIIMIVLLFGGYFFLRNRRNIKQNPLVKRSIISDNEVFMEIIALAKSNDPAFLGRFKEVYPQFFEELTERYPGILNSELAFCAYLKLNFTTKDIATFTYVTPSAVRNRKNRMKKKFGIPVHMDIYGWIDRIPKN